LCALSCAIEGRVKVNVDYKGNLLTTYKTIQDHHHHHHHVPEVLGVFPVP